MEKSDSCRGLGYRAYKDDDEDEIILNFKLINIDLKMKIETCSK